MVITFVWLFFLINWIILQYKFYGLHKKLFEPFWFVIVIGTGSFDLTDRDLNFNKKDTIFTTKKIQCDHHDYFLIFNENKLGSKNDTFSLCR